MNRLYVAVAAWFTLAFSTPALCREVVVWQIGKPDRDWSEFAFAGNWQAYARQPGAKPVIYDIGRSDPARDWPFIQPGREDRWSTVCGQPRTIRFELPEEPSGVYTLRVEFTNVQCGSPPRFVVAVGDRSHSFQLLPGSRDESLRDPRAGQPQKIEATLPAAFFKRGANEIRLTCAEGSWVLYDAVTLLADAERTLPAAEIQSVTVQPMPVFFPRGGQPRRTVAVAVALTAPPADLRLRVEAEGQTREVPLHPLAATATAQDVVVPCTAEPLDVKITAVSGRSEKTAALRLMPPRKWRIYVAASTHTDIGYTDVQPKCAERHCQNLDRAIELIHRFPDFRWNLEVAWQAENYVNTRSPRQLDEFYRLARQGKIGIQALYANMLTGLCSPEEFCRLTWYAHKLCREQGIPYGSAMISDVPTQVGTLPMILAGAGIRYFSAGINGDRAFPFSHMQRRSPCWWEGPDGSRVLMVFSEGYARASVWRLDRDLEQAETMVLRNLRPYETRGDYPFDAVFLHGAFVDNTKLNADLVKVVHQWNDRYDYPKLILSPNAAFFEYVEKHYGNKLKVYRGSGGTYWEDGAASSARETALSRHAHETLANGEKLLALADRIGRTNLYRSGEVNAAWRNCLLYDEHTWGADCSVSKPDCDFTKAQWKIKSQFAADAAAQAGAILDRGSKALAGLVKAEEPALVVFNAMSWPRSDVLRVALPEGMTITEPGVTCVTDGEAALAVVKDVPACGYRLLKLGPGRPTAAAEAEAGTTIESRFYRLRFDPASGAILSVLDKSSGRELLDAKAAYRGNQYLYVSGGDNPADPGHIPQGKPLTVSSPQKAVLRRLRLGDLGERMVVETSGTMTPKITTTVTVWNDLPRVDIVNRLTKTQTYEKEAAYFAFPFAARQPVVRHEIPCGIVSVNKDMLPGACLDWFTVQHYVEIADRGGAIAWATPDAPLVCLEDINRGKWQTSLPLVDGHLFSYAMTNYYYTNYLAGQGGDFTFRFAIASRPKADNVASAQFGWAVSNPLSGILVAANPAGPLPGEPTSLVSIAEPNVMLIAAKQADEGRGLALRLWELTGRATTAHLTLDGHIPAATARACNLVEEPQAPLEIRGGRLAVPIRGAGLATVRID